MLQTCKTFIFLSLFIFSCFQQATAQVPQKIIAECTIVYAVNSGENNSGKTIKKLYIKGRKTRSEISNPAFFQATIFDNKTGDAVVLKEIGGNKYISSFNAEQWKEKNKTWADASVKITNETKTILSYNCRKAITTMNDGSHFVVYFTADINASATENPYQFKDIPGLILEYKSSGTGEGKSIEFVATDINFSPVPAAKFAIPTTEYRILR